LFVLISSYGFSYCDCPRTLRFLAHQQCVSLMTFLRPIRDVRCSAVSISLGKLRKDNTGYNNGNYTARSAVNCQT